MAEDAVNHAAMAGGLAARSSPTKTLRLHGWRAAGAGDPELAEYGADAAELPALSESAGDTLLHPRLRCRTSQVIWAVRREMARTVEDVLARRLRVLPLDARAAAEMAPQVALLMATELGRDTAWEEQQVLNFRELALHYLFP